ncbi:MAG TPA: NAD(P)H-dependent oxidoreductase [Panacibacter sp.]|nr:NAD(P)H-dependent oxidoreductase [Panacibacter sp.]
MKIVAIPGSLRAGSSTHAIIKAFAGKLPADVEFEIYNVLQTLPHFNDSDEIPVAVNELRNLIMSADGILFCTPEYAFGIPGSLKNALDWMVGSTVLTNKPTAVITAATGGDKAHASLLLVLTALSAKVTGNSKLLISFVRSKLNEKGEVKDAATAQAIASVATALITSINNSEKKMHSN